MKKGLNYIRNRRLPRPDRRCTCIFSQDREKSLPVRGAEWGGKDVHDFGDPVEDGFAG